MFPFCQTCGAAQSIYVFPDDNEIRYCYVCGSLGVKMCGNQHGLAVPHITLCLTHNESSSLSGDLLRLHDRLMLHKSEDYPSV